MDLLCDVVKSPSSPPQFCLCSLGMLLTPRAGTQHFYFTFQEGKRMLCWEKPGEHESIETLGGPFFFFLQILHRKMWQDLPLEHWEGKPKISLWSIRMGKPVAGALDQRWLHTCTSHLNTLHLHKLYKTQVLSLHLRLPGRGTA